MHLASQMQVCVCKVFTLPPGFFFFLLASLSQDVEDHVYKNSTLCVVSCWFPKWVWAGKHAFPCSDCVVVVVSAALKKIKSIPYCEERYTLRRHISVRFSSTDHMHSPHGATQIDMFAGIHAFSEMHGDVCTLAGMHRHSEHQL